MPTLAFGRTCLFAAAAALMVAVASARPAQGVEPPAARPGGPNAAPAPIVVHFAGPAEARFAAGPPAKAGDVFIQRTVDRAARTITDVIHTARFGQPVDTATVVSTLTIRDGDADAIVKESSGRFEGVATLTGEPWNWSSRTLNAAFTNGVRLVVKEAATASGITVEREMFDEAGRSSGVYTERLRSVSRRQFEEALRAAQDRAAQISPLDAEE